MAYIGSSATPMPVAFAAVQSQSFNGTGSQTAFTISRSVPSAASLEILVDNVQQSPYDGSYSVNGTTLTFSEAPSSGTNNVYVIYRDQALGSLVDSGAVRKAGDTMTGDLVLAQSAASNPVRSLFITNTAPTGNVGQGAQISFGNDVGSSAATPSGWIRTINRNGATQASAMVFGGYTGGGMQEHMVIEPAGQVKMPYQPAFYARFSSNSALLGSGVQVFNAAVVNIGGNYNTGNGRFTAPVAGQYLICANTQHYGGSAAAGYCDILVNAGLLRGLRMESSDLSYYATRSASGVISLNAGDYVEFFCTAANVFWSDHTSFSGHLIG